MTLDEFQRQVFAVAISSPICEIPIVRRTSATSINLRIEITVGGFLDVFYNQQTGTTAYAWVIGERRIFGVDNTGGWHVHPIEDPAQHDHLEGPISFNDFVTQIESYNS
ncbi:MAG: hypothetical protein KDI55_15140 [Anaerolineae bacterium]|nr:hypothetical protein [Anaerolineae bacterium]